MTPIVCTLHSNGWLQQTTAYRTIHNTCMKLKLRIVTYTAKALEWKFGMLPHSLQCSVDEEFDHLVEDIDLYAKQFLSFYYLHLLLHTDFVVPTIFINYEYTIIHLFWSYNFCVIIFQLKNFADFQLDEKSLNQQVFRTSMQSTYSIYALKSPQLSPLHGQQKLLLPKA